MYICTYICKYVCICAYAHMYVYVCIYVLCVSISGSAAHEDHPLAMIKA